LLKKCEPDFRQISQQINRAIRDMHTFALVAEDDPEWAATIAYQSMLRVGRALLYSYGYLPADGQQHKTVVELTGEILGRKICFLEVKYNFSAVPPRKTPISPKEPVAARGRKINPNLQF
jgi:hypothetical protein